MSQILQIFNQPLGHRFGWALLHSIWQGALGAVLFALIRFAMRRQSADARYLAACTMLAALVAAPIITVFYLPTSALRPAPALYSRRSLPSMPDTGSPRTATNPVAATFSPAYRYFLNRAQQLNQALPWIVQIWALGVLALSFRWLHASCWIRRVKTSETEPLDPAWLERLGELRHRLNIARPVMLLKSALVEVPTVVGWLRPVILLPASTLTGLTPGQLEAILAHELAHVRRCDYLVNWFQNLVETLMFYHPAVWWISRCVREEREHCCDDLVVQVCGDKLVYARALMTLEEARALPSLAFAANGGSLLHRIRRLLGIANEDRPPSATEFGGIALVATGCIFILSSVWLFNRPSLYDAAALIRINPGLALLNGATEANGYFPYFLQTECLVMRSPAVLNGVIESIKRAEDRQRPEQAAARSINAQMLNSLKARLDVHLVPSTSAIEIRATDSDPAEAARIANAVANIYKHYRLEQSRNSARGAMEAQELGLQEQEVRLTNAQAKLDQLRVELKVPDEVLSENMPTVLLSAESLRHIESLRIESEAEYVKQKTILEQLETLDQSNLSQTLPAVGVQDNQLNEYMQALAIVDQHLIALQKEMGPEHPEVLKALAEQADLREKIRDRTMGIMTGLRAKTTATCNSLAALSNAVAQAVRTDNEQANRSKPYFDVKRNLEDLVQFIRVLRAKLASDRTRDQPPDLIEIVEEAAAPIQPLSPNRSRVIALAGVGLLLIMAGGVITRMAQTAVGSPQRSQHV